VDYAYQVWSLVDSSIRIADTWNSSTAKTAQVQLVPITGFFQVSEQGRPSETPATNAGLLDAPRDETIEAIGSMGDGVIFCTRSSTYALVWQSTPIGVTGANPPQTASPGYGCIATNTMVDAAGAPLWISSFGPAVFSGGIVDLVGQDLDAMFNGPDASILRDRTGRMRHAFACHDAERGLVYFGVFQNLRNQTIDYLGTTYTWDTAPDEARGRFPCDTILVLSISSRAWSIWYPPQDVRWMFSGKDAKGMQRVFWLGADGNIYVLDDSYAQYNRDPFRTTVSASVTGQTITVDDSFGVDIVAHGSADNRVLLGMNIMVLDGDGPDIRVATTVQAFDVAAKTITLPASLSVLKGDKVIVGYRSMRIISKNLHISESDKASSVRAISLRHEETSRFTFGSSATQQPAYTRVSVTTPKRHGSQDVVTHYATSYLTSSYSDASRFEYLGLSEAVNLVRDFSVSRALPAGPEAEISIEVLCPAQVSIHDVSVELP
jgi:hypothetical protein